MKRSKVCLTVENLKQERLTALPFRQDEIDTEIVQLEPRLTHDEAVYLVQTYEAGG